MALGALKIFFGYAEGVGTSVRMFEEACRRRERGEDVIIGGVQPGMAVDVSRLAMRLEAVSGEPLASVFVIDVPAVLRRRPQICVVDGLASDNPPGSRNAKRYQDVEELLRGGISVLTSTNIDCIEEEQPLVECLMGIGRQSTIPQRVVEAADEVQFADAPPHVLLAKSEASDAATRAIWARQLAELRERARLLAVAIVERHLSDYLWRQGVEAASRTRERILVCLPPHADSTAMLASARREADRTGGEVFILHILPRKSSVRAILEYARAHAVTQLFAARTSSGGWCTRFTGSFLDRLIDDARDMDVRVFPNWCLDDRDEST